MRRSLVGALALVLLSPVTAAALSQARAGTTGCSPLTVEQRIRIVNIRVARVSCAEAKRIIRRFLNPTRAEARRIAREFDRRGYTSLLGYRFKPVRGSDDSLHARGFGGRNFYFTFGPRRLRDPDEPPEPRFDELVRTLVLNRQVDSRLRVVAADLFSDGVVVRYSKRGPIDWSGPPGRSHFVDVQLRDDLGTKYQFVSGGGSGDGDHLRGEHEFAPAVPPNATRLTITIRNRAPIEVALQPSAAGKQPPLRAP